MKKHRFEYILLAFFIIILFFRTACLDKKYNNTCIISRNNEILQDSLDKRLVFVTDSILQEIEYLKKTTYDSIFLIKTVSLLDSIYYNTEQIQELLSNTQLINNEMSNHNRLILYGLMSELCEINKKLSLLINKNLKK